MRYSLLFYLSFLSTRYKRGGVTRTSFIAGPRDRGILGGSRGFLYCRLLKEGNQDLVKNFLCPYGGAAIRTICWQWKVAPWGGVTKGESKSLAACELAWEIWVLCWANPCVDEALTALECYQGCPALQEDIRTWNAASCGGFWQGGSYIQLDVW